MMDFSRVKKKKMLKEKSNGQIEARRVGEGW